MKTPTRRFLFLIALFFSLLTPPTIVHAATFTVTNLNDSGPGSLRQAITDANTATGADAITFGVSGTIPLASTLPNITDAAGLTMDGAGQTVTISGGNAVRVIFVNARASLTLNNLTIANGKISSGIHGGGIYNGGTLTVTNSTIFGNNTTSGYGGGIFNNGSLSVTNSTFSANGAPLAGGGGIMNTGTLTVTNSSFTDNLTSSGGHGGGIFNNSGTATVTNSAFYSNSTLSGGYGNGGAIYIYAGAVTITNSTFAGNSMILGGGIYNLGTLTMTNNSFSGNSAPQGGDIYNAAGTTIMTNNTFSGNSTNPIYNAAGTVTLRNTIVANGTSGGNCIGTITNGGNNIDDGASCGWGSTNGSMSSTNPLLGTLANNGGPTLTFALLANSPAADGVTFNAPNNTPSTDQRGVARPQGARYDIGAYETTKQLGPNFVVNALADTDDTVCDYAPTGNCTLREAINAANVHAGADLITFTVNGTITLGSTLPFIVDTAGLTIDGTGQTVTISGNNAVQVIQVSDYPVYGRGIIVPLTLNHLTIANGNSGGGSGINNIEGTLTIMNSTLSGNNVTWWGGGIYNSAGILNITNTTFSGNISTSGGGGIYTSEGILNITNSTFSGNGGVDYDGGGSGIFNNMGIVTLRNTIIANGTSGGNCSGTFINGGNNIDSGTSCGWGSASGSKSSTNPLLSALANNGGPTKTIALLPGSSAIDGVIFNAPNNAPSIDQRGVTRPRGVRYDIGAYEVQVMPLYLPLVVK